MNKAEPKPSEQLKRTQEWFASIITRPIDENSHINPIAPSGKTMEEEAGLYIAPSAALKSAERIQLYNQQYWWRLLNALQTSFPLATRILGYRQFNQTIAIPYLEKYPPYHWSLSYLGDRLSRWVDEEYAGKKKEIIVDTIAIDWAYNMSFFAEHRPPVISETTSEGGSLSKVLSKKACLQPHLFLFKLEYDLFDFRDKLKGKSPDYWSNHHFPHLKHELSEGEKHFPELKKGRNYYFVLYRNSQNVVTYTEVPEVEFLLLGHFKKDSSIEEACQWLEDHGKDIQQEAAAHLQEWVQQWVVNQWLASGESSCSLL